ncbi:hypothetical protein DFP73DRAFT_586046 [Morchella snyderi]|nr:hypothetical protein DFP73DRAFT_586046 [Morchella snyderi]
MKYKRPASLPAFLPPNCPAQPSHKRVLHQQQQPPTPTYLTTYLSTYLPPLLQKRKTVQSDQSRKPYPTSSPPLANGCVHVNGQYWGGCGAAALGVSPVGEQVESSTAAAAAGGWQIDRQDKVSNWDRQMACVAE